MDYRKIILSSALAASVMPVSAQGTLEDYNRAYAVSQKFGYNKVLHNGASVHWEDSTNVFWYSTNGKDGALYYRVTPANADRKQLSSDEGKQLEEAENKKRGQWRPENYVGQDGREHYWSDVNDEREGQPSVSPDGTMIAFKYGNDIRITDKDGRKTILQTTDASDGEYYSAYINWSPDSKKIALWKIQAVPQHYIYYVEAAPRDQFQPKLHKQEYQKPGDALAQRTPVIFDVATGKQTVGDTKDCQNQWDLSNLRWQPSSDAVTFEYNQRGHKVYKLMSMSAADGKVTTLIEENEPKYVNWTRIWRHHFEDGKRILWTSERDGYNHLYLYADNQLKQITKGKWYVREIQKVDEENGIVYFSANGREGGQDPYFIHYYKIGLDGKGLKELTPEKANHRASFSPDFKYLVDTYSTPTEAPVTVLRNAADGSMVMTLEKADISLLEAEGWKAPEVFVAKGRDGKTDMWGLIYRPSNFDPAKKYPVVEYIYSGPGDQYVPKNFAPFNWSMSALAELGFIVYQVDGMTTSFRSKAFEEVCYKNLKDAGLPDHIAWIKAAAKKYPQIDIDRVGIFGCSAGGQEALGAVLFQPEFYKAAYSACGCHDNRMDKIWWNEQWMGYPIDSSYIECSNIENAAKLNRPLMLLWGELDDNVDPASSMKVVDALQKANKDFEMVIIPGAHHTMGESYGDHKRYDFFVKNLMGVAPPKWDEIDYNKK